MQLIACINHYDEPPRHLARLIASLPQLGVTNIITLDGRYPLYPTPTTNSPIEAHELITNTALAHGLTLTNMTSPHPTTEVDKRHRLYNQAIHDGEPLTDWMLLIDADEYIHPDHAYNIRPTLEKLPPDTHAAYLTRREVQYPEHSPKYNKITQQANIPPDEGRDTRLMRVPHQLQMYKTHFSIAADYGNGWVSIRNDKFTQNDLDAQPPIVHDLDPRPVMVHTTKERSVHRQELKRQYYDTRDKLRIER